MGRTVLSNRIVHRVGCMVALFVATTSVALPDSKAPDMAAVGAQLTTIFNERKGDTLAAMLDMKALGTRVAENVYESEKGRSEFVRGFTKTAQSSVLVKDFMSLLDRSPGSVEQNVQGQERR